MKFNLLYIVVFLFVISCKQEVQKSNKKESNIASIEVDTIGKTDKLSQEKNENTIRRFIGKSLDVLKQSKEFRNYSFGWGTIDSDENSDLNYSLGSFKGSGDIDKYVVFLKRNNGNKILDILNLTKEKVLEEDDKNLYYHFCYKDNKNDQEIIAIATYEEEEFLTKILKAWRADRKTEKIIEIPIDGITVSNEEYGL
ncbi:hypothetical protein AB832_02710 [Flavobacteriaceae bacterium (ex Bugula neritina AB1)]|nr:hypothetical protein AB832_02710 [Flavobacteriaceae bacterium (ex Bugula neritina AB1)]